MTTGDRIRTLRHELSMSQEELGKKIGVQKAAINKYETGIVVNLKASIIAKLAAALHTTPTYLMGYDENKTPTPKNESERIEREEVILKKLSALSAENLDIALAQLDVLLNHQDKKKNP